MFSVGLSARDIMQTPVVTIQENASIEEISDLLTGRMISGAPVVNEQGVPIGVVTLNDIVRNEPRREHIISDKIAANNILRTLSPQFDSEELTGFHLEESETMTAKDIMTPFVYHVDEATSLKEIARILVSAHIHRLFVFNGEEIVGVVSALDMLKSYLKSRIATD